MKKPKPLKIDIRRAIDHYNVNKPTDSERMTIRNLAPKLGVAYTTMYNYINGSCKCPIDIIQGIEKETGMPFSEFVPLNK